jgi:hypothetical protein
LALRTTTTIVVHHRCITGTALAVFCGIGGQGGSGWLSQIRRCGEGCGEESGLQACYGKAPHLRGFFMSLSRGL